MRQPLHLAKESIACLQALAIQQNLISEPLKTTKLTITDAPERQLLNLLILLNNAVKELSSPASIKPRQIIEALSLSLKIVALFEGAPSTINMGTHFNTFTERLTHIGLALVVEHSLLPTPLAELSTNDGISLALPPMPVMSFQRHFYPAFAKLQTQADKLLTCGCFTFLASPEAKALQALINSLSKDDVTTETATEILNTALLQMQYGATSRSLISNLKREISSKFMGVGRHGEHDFELAPLLQGATECRL